MCRLNDRAPTEIYTLPLHDALPISQQGLRGFFDGRDRLGILDQVAQLAILVVADGRRQADRVTCRASPGDRKSTRLNSSHDQISYAVFCLKKNTGKKREQVQGDNEG